MNNRKTYFISDLHLNENHLQPIDLFLSFLASCNQDTDCIYILGDLFEAYIGDDDQNPLQMKIINALKATIARDIPIYYIHGNRDFLIGSYFFQESGCIALSEETVVNVYNRPVLLMHGDTLCTNDHAYLRARRILRHPIAKKLFLALPLSFRKKIANRLRLRSKEYTKHAAMTIMDVVQKTVESKMALHHVNGIVHGHTHLPKHHEFGINQEMHRWVLGAWHDTAIILKWDEKHHTELIDIMKVQA